MIDSIAALMVAGAQQDFAIQALRAQLQNESATVNLVRDAVRAVPAADASPVDRHDTGQLVDVLV